MAARLLVVLALAVASCTSRSFDTRSATLSTAKDRVAFFCAAVMCPSRPDDVAFHIVHEEALFGPGDTTVHAVVKLPAADLAKWSKGCESAGVDARPAWLQEVLQGTGWKPTTAPDTVRCGQQTRVIHVKDGLVILTDERR
ncbi:MAG: hypothetical protein AB1938_03520 [Myxococcota bacterium]